jgi:RNA polymerase sigma-70 factor (ECF subfamily)
MTGALALPSSPPARVGEPAPERLAPLAGRIAPADFAAFYERVAPRLWGYVRSQVRAADEADELVQESFTRVLAARFEPENAEHLTRYLYRTAIHLLRDRGRAARRRAEPLAAHAEPEARCAPEGLRHDLSAAFAGLGERERQLLWLAHVEQLDHRAIGATLGARPGSVRVLLHRARRKLAARLGIDRARRGAQSEERSSP